MHACKGVHAPSDAESCLQVRVLHRPGSPTRQPLRVKAFAVLQTHLGPGQASMWLPCEASAPSAAASAAQHAQNQQHMKQPCVGGQCACKKAAVVPLKGPSVLSYRFLYTPDALDAPNAPDAPDALDAPDAPDAPVRSAPRHVRSHAYLTGCRNRRKPKHSMTVRLSTEAPIDLGSLTVSAVDTNIVRFSR